MALCSQNELSNIEFARFRDLIAEKDIDINCPALFSKFTPLLALCRHNKSQYMYRCLKFFLERKDVNLNLITHYWHNALTLLCRYYSQSDLIHCIRLLIMRHGINFNVLDRYRRPAYLLLCELYNGDNFVDVARLLFQSAKT